MSKKQYDSMDVQEILRQFNDNWGDKPIETSDGKVITFIDYDSAAGKYVLEVK